MGPEGGSEKGRRGEREVSELMEPEGRGSEGGER